MDTPWSIKVPRDTGPRAEARTPVGGGEASDGAEIGDTVELGPHGGYRGVGNGGADADEKQVRPRNPGILELRHYDHGGDHWNEHVGDQPRRAEAVDGGPCHQGSYHHRERIDYIAAGDPGVGPGFGVRQVEVVKEHGGEYHGRRQNPWHQQVEAGVAQHFSPRPGSGLTVFRCPGCCEMRQMRRCLSTWPFNNHRAAGTSTSASTSAVAP